MKKWITLSLALVLALTLAACGGDGGASGSGSTPTPPALPDNTPSAMPSADNTPSAQSPADDTPPSSEPSNDPEPPAGGGVPDGEAMAALIQWMKDGTFSYDFTMISEGPDGKTEGSGSMAIDGENMAMSQEMTVEGQRVQSRILKKGDKLYMIDDANKFIMEMPVEMDMTEGLMTDYGGITKIGEGTGEIDGKTLPYEEYAEDELGAAVKYYLDGGEVYGMVSEYEGYKTTMIITNPSGSVPSGAFDLPSGYTDMGAIGGGFNAGDYLPDGFELP